VDVPMSAPPVADSRRWSVTLASVWVSATSFLFINGVVFLIPSMASAYRISMAEAALLASMPSWGMVVTLILWGYLTDQLGERTVMTIGSTVVGVAACCAAWARSPLEMGSFLFIGGMAAASSNTAAGSLVSGWFKHGGRGVAMGIRQTSQPLGIGLAALLIPQLAGHGPRTALVFLAAASTLSAVTAAVRIVDPPRVPRPDGREEAPPNPYRSSFALWRIHLASALLMMPQQVTATFMLTWLVHVRGWSIVAAGGVVTASQLLGAVGRIAVGRWSDLIGSRMRPVRLLAFAAAAMLFALALFDQEASGAAVWMMIAVSVLAVLDNGLEATAITEFAGIAWSGRALGVQNTGQRLMASAATPLFEMLIAASHYPIAWAICGLFPLLAIPLVPVWLIPEEAKGGTDRRPSHPLNHH
jgi:MFS family permease